MDDATDRDFAEDSPYRGVFNVRYYRCSICREELSGRVKALGHIAIHVDCLERLDEAKRWPAIRFAVQLEVDVKAMSRPDALGAIEAALGVGSRFGSLAQPEITVIRTEVRDGPTPSA